MNPELFLAEFLGTFALIFAILATGNFVAIGTTLAATIFLLGGISGANLNPAVSLAMLLTGKISTRRFVFYALTQMAASGVAVYAYNMTKK